MKKYVQTSTILSIKYATGSLIASDTKCSYGSLHKYSPIKRIFPINNTLIGLSGELSDIQELSKLVHMQTLRDSAPVGTGGYKRLVQRMLYARRSRLEPLDVFAVVCGEGMPYGVNALGNFYESAVVCSGMGAYLVLPYLSERVVEGLTREQAVKLAEDALRMCYYRDARASNEIQVGYVDEEGCNVSEPYCLDSSWEIGRAVSY